MKDSEKINIVNSPFKDDYFKITCISDIKFEKLKIIS